MAEPIPGLSGTCSWCHAINPITRERCSDCGHDAHAPRMLCQCPSCRPPVPRRCQHPAEQRSRVHYSDLLQPYRVCGLCGSSVYCDVVQIGG